MNQSKQQIQATKKDINRQMKAFEKQALRFTKIPNMQKIDFDDLISFAEEISSIGGNGTIEVKLHDYKITLFKRHHKTYPKKTN